MIVLGIETSCDETAASVVRDGEKVLSSVVASQVAVHRAYGGVVPELASRKHMEAIVPVVQDALREAAVPTQDLDGIAATQGPGLVGALLVGFSFAKGFAYARGLPWVGVNHLEGHVYSVFLEPDPPPFPFVALLVSGGHTDIYHVTSHLHMERMGQSLDDAAGEAFDKVSKMLGLGYPGGQLLDALARRGDRDKIRFPRAYLDKERFDFSFSGIKTAVKRYIDTHTGDLDARIPDIAAGFQEAVVEVLVSKALHAAIRCGCRHLAVVGGVAANSRLREKVAEQGAAAGLEVLLPSPSLCGDNAAMIAAAGYHHLMRGENAPLDTDVFSRVARVG